MAHSNMLISEEHIAGSTFKLTGRDGDICFILRFFFFKSGYISYHLGQSLNL